VTEQELRELDELVGKQFYGLDTYDAPQAFGHWPIPKGTKKWLMRGDGSFLSIHERSDHSSHSSRDWSPTRFSGDSMELLKKLLSKNLMGLYIYYTGSETNKGDWHAQAHDGKKFMDEGAETLEIALCLLAKKIYEKQS